MPLAFGAHADALRSRTASVHVRDKILGMSDTRVRRNDNGAVTGTVNARHEPRPKVSVVAVTREGAQTAARAIAGASFHCQRLGVELIVVCAGRQGGRSSLSATNGVAKLIHGPADVSEQRLRALGFAAATGDVVMLVEDLADADESWIRHVSVTGVPRQQSMDNRRSDSVAPSPTALL